MIDRMIVDADLCIKLGSSSKYRYLYDILPLVSKEIYVHTHVQGEVMSPVSAVEQLGKLISEGKVEVVDERRLTDMDKAIYHAAYKKLEAVMIDPKRANKNKGEVCSMAYAKAKGIPIFATDEKDLQPIIDSQLNTGISDDITCIRIEDIVKMARDGKLEISRKTSKIIWAMAGKSKDIFDNEIWPLTTTK